MKDNRKNGFTLVEILSIIIILSMVVVIGVPVYQSSSRKSKEKMYRAKLDNANQSGKLWALDNTDCFKDNVCEDKITLIECEAEGFGANDKCYLISLETLAAEGYYSYDDESGNIINPKDNSLMNNEQILIVYNTESKKISNHSLKSYLYKVITFDSSLERIQNHLVTIDNLYEIDSIKVNTGSISFNRDKDNIALNFSNGDPSSSQWNSTLYEKTTTANSTSSTDSFSNTYNYDDGEYIGTLNKSGVSSVISGSYIPADTKFVTGQTSGNYNSEGYTGALSIYVHSGEYTPEDTKYVSGQTSSYYNSGGYTGTLSSYLYSGSYTPSDSKTVTQNSGSYTWGHYLCPTGVCYKSQAGEKPNTASISYNSGGYSGTLYFSEWSGTHPNSPITVPTVHYMEVMPEQQFIDI